MDDMIVDNGYYVQIPVSQYQLANLLGLLRRNKKLENGDWWNEWVNIVQAVGTKFNWTSVTNNFGDTFTFGPDEKRLWEQVNEYVPE